MRYKRVDMLIRLMVPITAKYPGAVLHVIGFGPAENVLKRMADQCGMTHHVVFHGYVSEEDKVVWLQRAWVVVTASMKEGWGLVAVEANACGTPVVSFNVPGLCEAIMHSQSGLLVESEQEFAEAVLCILGDRDLRDSLSRTALRHAEQFGWDRTADLSLGILLSEVDYAASRQPCAVRSGAPLGRYHRPA